MGASSAIQSRRSSQRRHEVNDALLTKRGSGYARDVVAIPGGLTAAHDRSWRDVPGMTLSLRLRPPARWHGEPGSHATCRHKTGQPFADSATGGKRTRQGRAEG
jgi:hypothetical protein